jgi:aprataxin
LYATEGLLSATLTCFKCDEPFNNIPKLKAHLEEEFVQAKKVGLKQLKDHGRQKEFTGGDDFF